MVEEGGLDEVLDTKDFFFCSLRVREGNIVCGGGGGDFFLSTVRL